MQQLQDEYGRDQLVPIYWHLSDIYEIPEGRARAQDYDVSGVPEVDFDAVVEVVGAGTSVINTYRPIVCSGTLNRDSTLTPLHSRTPRPQSRATL